MKSRPLLYSNAWFSIKSEISQLSCRKSGRDFDSCDLMRNQGPVVRRLTCSFGLCISARYFKSSEQ